MMSSALSKNLSLFADFYNSLDSDQKSKITEKMGIPEGDFRDFEKIQPWALKTAWPRLMTS